MRILLADEDRGLLLSMGFLLESVGIESDGCPDGLSALGCFRTAHVDRARPRYDAFVTAWTLPGMPAADLVRRIRAIDSEIPVVVLSGGFGADPWEAMSPSRCVQRLEKPFDRVSLLRALERAGLPARAVAARRSSETADERARAGRFVSTV